MSKVAGLSNRIMNDMITIFLSSQDICKLLTVYDDVDILDEEDIENTYWLFNKHIFVKRRDPELMNEVGAYLTVRMTRCEDRSTSKTKVLEDGIIEVYIIVHSSLLHTRNGSRDIALVSLVKECLGVESVSTVGKVSIVDVKDMYQLPVDYTGYRVACEYTGYRQTIIQDED